ncbi:hypothetical protein DSO57_1013931 [Entomophthora muscae]|uniref:Uncharacterized protein n=1 Tax=Entomophthora muscae TaxID=34485 RepID=A0ACC2US80_9FUNG|nr:hypothetical protein DSO57_1013931 [Entomophthora muscae]
MKFCQVASLLSLTLVDAYLNTQVKTALSEGAYQYSFDALFTELFLDSMAMDLPRLKVPNPPKKLDRPGKAPHASIEEMRDGYKYAMASLCLAEDFNGGQCVCPPVLRSLHIVEARQFGSLGVIGLDHERKLIVASYRQTLTTNNQATNAEYQQTHPSGAPRRVGVHYGQWSSHLSLMEPMHDVVLKMMEDPATSDYSLLITGRGSGGSVALLSVPEWMEFLQENKQSKRPVKVQLYSNGRVGNAAFADYINSFKIPVTRMTMADDTIPHLPPRELNFTHVGVEIHEKRVNGKPSFKLCSQEYDEDPECVYASRPKDVTNGTALLESMKMFSSVKCLLD